MSLGLPPAAPGLANPHRRGIVIVTSPLWFFGSPAVERVDDVVRRHGRVRGEDTNLKVAQFVRLELAVLQVDQKSIDSLDVLVDSNKILGEEAADRSEGALSEARHALARHAHRRGPGPRAGRT